ncbi:DUF4166 domain-containing protein [Pseudogemmobacter bohemicus]|uniref:DUF4166 domain-containing protein n=1 Tax=Pseudogemmobacter bohemicus TaxID=2250708 RepID=UPI000DD4B3B5|nr:SDR family oxidoreductase [Pseudogemmobacter bohemicus]
MKILILGGYGVFGGRLAELLADCPGLELLICGRDAAKARQFCARQRGGTVMTPLALDRSRIAEALRMQAPDMVVDASGPFQSYAAQNAGHDPWLVIRACIAARIDYMDFADSADFVFAVPEFDQAAREAGIFVLAGVSSFPVLTAAVLRRLSQGMELRSVEGGIAPSPYAGIGLNVMRAVVSYAGAPVKLTRGGQAVTARGLTESRRYTITVPGRVPLRNLRFSLVDVPDLQVLPPEFPGLQEIWMGAGPVPESLHRILNLLAKLRAALSLPSLVPLAGLFYRVLNLMKFGEHRGGMYVAVTGRADGREVSRSWHLLAEGDDGPYIPSMAIEALVRRLLQGERPAPGARAATAELELEDYDRLFAGRTIYTGLRDRPGPEAPLYERILGPALAGLPDPIRRLHDLHRPASWSGEASVRRGRGLIARLLCRVFGFPPETAQVPVTVRFTPGPEGEVWERDFGGRRFRSHQSEGRGRNSRLIVERFGPFSFGIALVVEKGQLILRPRRWSFLGIPMPKFLLPNGHTFEQESDGQFQFNVEIAAPLIGLIVAYKGHLQPGQGSDPG